MINDICLCIWCLGPQRVLERGKVEASLLQAELVAASPDGDDHILELVNAVGIDRVE